MINFQRQMDRNVIEQVSQKPNHIAQTIWRLYSRITSQQKQAVSRFLGQKNDTIPKSRVMVRQLDLLVQKFSQAKPL